MNSSSTTKTADSNDARTILAAEVSAFIIFVCTHKDFGLEVLKTGTTDDGTAIDAYVRTFLTDFGTHKFKRAPDIWVGIATDGRMLAKVRTRDPASGAVLDDWYELVTKQDGNEANGRAKVGRGLKSVWWGLELRNINGSDFRVDEAGLRYLVLDRRQ